jgi:hypothetical protein
MYNNIIPISGFYCTVISAAPGYFITYKPLDNLLVGHKVICKESESVAVLDVR